MISSTIHHGNIVLAQSSSTPRQAGLNSRQYQRRDIGRLDSKIQALGESTLEDEKAVSNLDVSGATVEPSFRSTPWGAEENESENRKIARIAVVSESNVCRSVLAEAIMNFLLKTSSLQGIVIVESRATRDHNLGGGAETSPSLVAEERGYPISPTFEAKIFDYQRDTVHFDLVLVMDKFDCQDVMREISVFDTINKSGKYSQKVRRLGEFHPILSKERGSEAQDIEDALYGNVGGEEELDAVRQIANILEDSCRGLVAYLEQINARPDDRPFPQVLREDVTSKEQLDWLVPPMLQRR